MGVVLAAQSSCSFYAATWTKARLPRAHPRRLVNLFGEVHDPRLKPKGFVETVGDLTEAAEAAPSGVVLGQAIDGVHRGGPGWIAIC